MTLRFFSRSCLRCLIIALPVVPLVASPVFGAAPLLDMEKELLLFEEIPSVFGASKYEQKTTEAPSAVTIVTSEEIELYGYRTLGDILKNIRSFYLTDDRNYQYMGVRGFGRPGDYNSRLLVLVDGHRSNENIFDGASVENLFLLDIDLIDRLEVIRGPSSSLYGTGAFFGVINIITKRGRDLQGVEMALSADPFEEEYGQGRFTYGHRYESGFEVLVSGSFGDYNGVDWYYKEFDDPASNNGLAEDLDWERHGSGFLKLAFNDLLFTAKYVQRKDAYPTAAWESVFNHPETSTIDSQLSMDLSYEHSFSNQLRASAQLTYDTYDYEGHYPFDWSEDDEPDIYVGLDEASGRSWGLRTEVSKDFDSGHRLIAGLSYRDETRQDQRYYDDRDDPDSLILDSEESSRSIGIFVQDEFAVCDKASLNLGVRYDHYSTFGDTINPRLALIYWPFEAASLKFLYGEAFRAPSAYELHYHDGGLTSTANPDLEPETIQTYELVWEQRFGNRWQGLISGFFYEIDNLINYRTDQDDLLFFDNIGHVDAHGIEMELEGALENGLKGRLSYTWQQTENREKGEELSNSPEHLAKLALSAPVMDDRLKLGLEGYFSGSVSTVHGGDLDDVLTWNLTVLGVDLFGKDLRLSATVYNLFDKGYSLIAGEEHIMESIEQLGRHYRLKMTYTF